LILDNGSEFSAHAKKIDMATLSQEEIGNGIMLLNLTPRKVLKGLTPLEVFTGKRVALIT
jgi:IS30 family transposase